MVLNTPNYTEALLYNLPKFQKYLQKSIVRDGKKGKMPAVGWLYLHIMQKRLLLYNWVQNLGRCQYKKYTQNRFSSLQKKRAQTLKVVSNSCYFYT
jgi:hypothetical protein